MVVTRSIEKVKSIIRKVRQRGESIGFVPTMGALHLGHLSLVRRAREECDFVVVSIFVNPLQFGPGEDYKKYPRAREKDEKLLKKEGVDFLFHPVPRSMYVPDASTYVEETQLSQYLCGLSRPAHFRGVCTVVAKLFNIVQPDISYFGQKDYQQAQIIKRMVRDLNFPVTVKILPIVREKDGLAISSRNSYLNRKEREDARCLVAALFCARELIKRGERDPKRIITKMEGIIHSKESARIDYINIKDARNLEEVKTVKGKVLIALAVYVGNTRLIDNIVINVRKN